MSKVCPLVKELEMYTFILKNSCGTKNMYQLVIPTACQCYNMLFFVEKQEQFVFLGRI